MNRIILFIVFVVRITNLYSQYYTSYCSGDSAYEIGNYKEAIKLYRQKINLGDEASRRFFPVYYYSIASCFALLGKTDSSFINLQIFIDNNADISRLSDILNDDDLQTLHSDNRWVKIEKKIKDLFYTNSLASDKDLAYAFFKKSSSDQKYRRIILSHQKKYGNESVKVDSLWKLQNTIDSVNILFLDSVINKHTHWPDIDKVGVPGNSVAFLILQHSNLEKQKRYLPLLKESAEKYQSQPQYAAMLEDRILVREGKKQIYGTQLKTDKQTGKMKFSPIADEWDIDVRRTRVGLGSMKEYAKQWGIDYLPVQLQPVVKDSLQAPLFRTVDINGDSLILSNLIDNVVVLNFWGLSCKSCLKEIPRLNELANKNKNEKIIFIAITEDNQDKVRGYLAKQKFLYTQVTDAQYIIDEYVQAPLKAKLKDDFAMYKDIRPTHIIIDKSGNVIYYSWGASNEYPFWIDERIRKLLSEEN